MTGKTIQSIMITALIASLIAAGCLDDTRGPGQEHQGATIPAVSPVAWTASWNGGPFRNDSYDWRIEEADDLDLVGIGRIPAGPAMHFSKQGEDVGAVRFGPGHEPRLFIDGTRAETIHGFMRLQDSMPFLPFFLAGQVIGEQDVVTYLGECWRLHDASSRGFEADHVPCDATDADPVVSFVYRLRADSWVPVRVDLRISDPVVADHVVTIWALEGVSAPHEAVAAREDVRFERPVVIRAAPPGPHGPAVGNDSAFPAGLQASMDAARDDATVRAFFDAEPDARFVSAELGFRGLVGPEEAPRTAIEANWRLEFQGDGQGLAFSAEWLVPDDPVPAVYVETYDVQERDGGFDPKRPWPRLAPASAAYEYCRDQLGGREELMRFAIGGLFLHPDTFVEIDGIPSIEDAATAACATEGAGYMEISLWTGRIVAVEQKHLAAA